VLVHWFCLRKRGGVRRHAQVCVITGGFSILHGGLLGLLAKLECHAERRDLFETEIWVVAVDRTKACCVSGGGSSDVHHQAAAFRRGAHVVVVLRGVLGEGDFSANDGGVELAFSGDGGGGADHAPLLRFREIDFDARRVRFG